MFPRPLHPLHYSPAFPGLPHSLSANMAPKFRWRDPQGDRTLTKIVKEQIPQWKDGLYPSQHNLVRRILDGQKILCCMVTGGGKSALFAVPIIVLREMARNHHLYPDLPTRALPQGIVVTPTKGLAANIVRFLCISCTYTKYT
jgi:superfamily II DNA or RNA helicase